MNEVAEGARSRRSDEIAQICFCELREMELVETFRGALCKLTNNARQRKSFVN